MLRVIFTFRNNFQEFIFDFISPLFGPEFNSFGVKSTLNLFINSLPLMIFSDPLKL